MQGNGSSIEQLKTTFSYLSGLNDNNYTRLRSLGSVLRSMARITRQANYTLSSAWDKLADTIFKISDAVSNLTINVSSEINNFVANTAANEEANLSAVNKAKQAVEDILSKLNL